MSFIRTIPAEEATGVPRDLYERQQHHYGYLPNGARVFCCRPELVKLRTDPLLTLYRQNWTLCAHAEMHSLGCLFHRGEGI